MPRPEQRLGARACLIALTCAGLAAFFRGYFPVKPLVPGYTQRRTYAPRSATAAPAHVRSAQEPFSRLVFVLVDALRSDFVYGPSSSMNFTRSLIESGKALPYTAVAQAPTVTLPRLKALTTGSNPTFLDAILNIADEGSSTAALESADSWLRQFVHRDGSTRLMFAGDDTWLRLFPSRWFAWSEGVSSFFVSDTRTVDSNVTRHLDSLLGSEPATANWDVLILHYLGLDHVGHLEGPQSLLMQPKQVEMDQVVQRLFEALELRDVQDGKKSLLVLVGDHGMTEGGNHGGSTEPETSSALVFASPALGPASESSTVVQSGPYRFYETVQQVDLVPTLSVLFDLGIPNSRNSVGKIIGSAIERLRPAALAAGVAANVEQVSDVLRSAGLLDRFDANRVHRHEEAVDAQTSLAFLKLAQVELLASFAEYRMRPLLASIILFSTAALIAVWNFYMINKPSTSSASVIVGGAVLAHLGSFFATSFIEEEHEFWFFATATSFVVLACTMKSLALADRLWSIAAACSIRLMRGWSHNGQKDFANRSISASLARHSALSVQFAIAVYIFVATASLFSLGVAARSLSKCKLSVAELLQHAITFAVLATVTSLQAVAGVACKVTEDLLAAPLWLAATLEKVGLDRQVLLIRISYIAGGFGLAAMGLAARRLPQAARQNLQNVRLAILSLLLLTVTRKTNAPLFVLFWVQHVALSRLSNHASPVSFAFLSVALQSCSFFALGGSNSLATVDLSQAYNGLSAYSFPLVTLLTYVSNFSGPIFFSVSTRTLTPCPVTHSILTTSFFSCSLTTLAISAFHFRHHLFAFTVFSPAVLYKGVWWILVQLVTNEIFSRLIVLNTL
ncbi:mannose-ethanolamine phosphotransferase LAS21 [Sporobolomyces koalae]|uniref:mannose-ethanolamine phosphotransferase LAS21 n=1 Tax=Sporobolomyces koalae TaxID=500713 RepID=UPI00317A3E98